MQSTRSLVHAASFKPCSVRATALHRSKRHGAALALVCRARRSYDEDDDDVLPKEVVREVITFFTADGIVQLPGRRVLRPVSQHKKMVAPMPTWEEQSLCIGASFTVAATNGLDGTRRIAIEGFCQSIDYLFESVQDALASELRGEVLMQERQLKSGLHEVLKLTVAVPFLFGVPPQLDVLNEAIRTGGGIVDRVRHSWLIQAGL